VAGKWLARSGVVVFREQLLTAKIAKEDREAREEKIFPAATAIAGAV